jgi:4-diphosphocytidyl-2-C-methyl-D-erythritol kinase
MTTVEAFAPAKINLTLHVTGRRADGYHLLDSLVAFADLGDTVTASPAGALTLEIDGPFAKGLSAGADNLVLRAARLFGSRQGAAIRLTKRLPVAAGIGGGSADAAAALRALSALWERPLPAPEQLLALGADVPACLASEACRMRGVGEDVAPGAGPRAAIVLVNPGTAVATPAVFRALDRRENPGMPTPPRAGVGHEDWIVWLAAQRNDLEAPAIALAPEIGEILGAVGAQPGCRLARMSGSGATCFGLFDGDARGPAADLKRAHPEWWVASAVLSPSTAPRGTSARRVKEAGQVSRATT